MCENEPALVHPGRERTTCVGSDTGPSACACAWASVAGVSRSGSAAPSPVGPRPSPAQPWGGKGGRGSHLKIGPVLRFHS